MNVTARCALWLLVPLVAAVAQAEGNEKAPPLSVPVKHYLEARKLLYDDDLPSAVELFERVVREHADSEVADDSLYWAAWCRARMPDSRPRAVEAWLRLLKNRPVPRVKMWLASTRESADQVFERYHTGGIVGASSVPVLKLALPAHIAASGRYVVQQIEAFQQKTTHIHQGLVADFERIVATVPYVGDSHQSLLPYKTDWADQWEGMLDEYFPA
jgi:hypothetical protein